MKRLPLLFLACGVLHDAAADDPLPSPRRFDFGSNPSAEGCTAVTPAMDYSEARGFGFEPGFPVAGINTGSNNGVIADAVVPEQGAFFFSVAVPEGNYRVRVMLGHKLRATETTVKSELRRLSLERVTTRPGEFVTRAFTVNVRTPRIAARDGIAAGEVKLKAPRETTQEAWGWDARLTLEFNGPTTSLCALEIAPVDVPTVFLLGDSTVCDQSREPFASWGQMLPRFLDQRVAVANHGESGETYRDSLGRRRIDKIASVLRPGDWVLLQFGHNDQKQIKQGTGGPFTTYREELKKHLAMVRAAGGVPVVVSPMERRDFDAQGKVKPSLTEYADAARQAAQEEGVAFIDLNALSKPLYEALGRERSARAFAAPEGKQDNTHTAPFGAYELAKCVLTAARRQSLGFAKFAVPEFADLDPANPDDLETFAVPPSPLVTNLRPLGD